MIDDIRGIHCPNLMLEFIEGFDLTDQRLSEHSFDILTHFVKHMMNQIGFGVLNELHSI